MIKFHKPLFAAILLSCISWAPSHGALLDMQRDMQGATSVVRTCNGVVDVHLAEKMYHHASLSYKENPQMIERAFKDCTIIPVNAKTGWGLEQASNIGYICADLKTERPQVTIAINGTNNFYDVLTDVNMQLVQLDSALSTSTSSMNAQVHCGFQDASISVLESIHEGLATLKKTIGQTKYESLNPILMTGHSLGAAIATLTGLALVNDHDVAPSGVGVVTFGAPSLGDEGLSQILEQKIPQQTHFHQKMDYVSQIKLHSGFAELPGRVALPSQTPSWHILNGILKIVNGILLGDSDYLSEGVSSIKEAFLRLHTLNGYEGSIACYFQKKTDQAGVLWKTIDGYSQFIWSMTNAAIHSFTNSFFNKPSVGQDTVSPVARNLLKLGLNLMQSFKSCHIS